MEATIDNGNGNLSGQVGGGSFSAVISGDSKISGNIAISGTISGTITIGGGAPKLQSKTVSAKTTAQTVTPDGGYNGLSDVTVNAVNTGTATDLDVRAGTTFARGDILGNIENVNGGMADNGDWSATLNSTSAVNVPWGYHSGSGLVSVDQTNLEAGNIKKGISILGVTGTYEGGGGTSQLEAQLFKSVAGKVTIENPGTYYGVNKVSGLTLSGCTKVWSNAFAYEQTGYVGRVTLPDVTNIYGGAFKNSALNTLHVGTAGSSIQTTIIGNAFSGCTSFKHLYLYNAVKVELSSDLTLATSLTIHVPADLLAEYQADAKWNAPVAPTGVTWVAL